MHTLYTLILYMYKQPTPHVCMHRQNLCLGGVQGPCGLTTASGLWPSYLEIALGGEGPATDGAAEGFLASVGALMDLQGTG